MSYAPKVMNGTHGKVWLEGYEVFEISGFSAKITFNKTEVPMCGQMMTDSKVTSMKGTGELKINKVFSRMQELMKDVENGTDKRFTMVAELKDPDAYGAERVALLNVSFDEMTVLAFAHNTIGEETIPFTFTGYKYYDMVEVRS